MQDPGYGILRIPLLGTWVNKGERAGPKLLEPGPKSLPYGNGLGFFGG